MPKLKMPREFYIPKDAVLVDAQGTDAAVYNYEKNGNLFAVGFHGKADKPDFHFYYKTEAQRAEAIQNFIDGRKAQAKYMAERKAERSKPHTLKLGDILYTSWGYDQTNVDFYQVVEVVGANSVKIQKVAQALSSEKESGGPADYVVAVPGKFLGDPMLKRVSAGNYITMTSYSSASLWNGKPKYQTGFGWGH